MRADPYLVYNGIEISNGNRVLTYTRNLAGPTFGVPGCNSVPIFGCEPSGYEDAYSDVYTEDASCEGEALACCFCAAIDVVGEDQPTYVSPAADPAPWYQASRVESGEFLGFFAASPRLSPVVGHSVSPRSGRGATLGSYSLRGRVMTVAGLMVSQSARGMAYGERWLTEALLGLRCLPRESCLVRNLRFLPACPGVLTEVEALPFFRHLVDVKLTDGPFFSQVVPNESVLQEVTFELTAGQPYILDERDVIMSRSITA